MNTILLIEDDADIAELLRLQLTRDGYAVQHAARGDAGWQLAKTTAPHCIVLDVMLPGMSGIDLCRAVRATPATAATPIVMISAKGEEADVVLGLELGADDYLVKPFRPRELIARIRAVVRRRQTPVNTGSTVLRVGPLTIDIEQIRAFVDHTPIAVTRAEFRLLCALASHPERVFTRDQLLDHITDGDGAIIDRNVDVHIRSLRKKFGAAAHCIETVRGIGYRLQGPAIGET